MNSIDPINTVIINGKTYSFYIMLYLILGTSLTMYLYWQFHETVILVSGLGIFWVLPGIFQTFFRKRFTKKVIVVFSDDLFTVEQVSENAAIVERKDENRYEDIESFRAMDSSKDDSSFLRINFKNGDTVKYTFLGQGNQKGQTNITEKFFDAVIAYNDLQKVNKIVLMPNLFATKAGSVYIILVTLILVGAIILQIIFKPQTIPISLFTGLILYLLIIGQRKRDVEQLKRINSSN